jgi:hypothetical protein
MTNENKLNLSVRKKMGLNKSLNSQRSDESQNKSYSYQVGKFSSARTEILKKNLFS